MTKTPKLLNDCFALPSGVEWTPVDTALAHLKAAVDVVVGTETIATQNAGGRILAVDAVAVRSNPPYANAAVDGYGFAFSSANAGQAMSLVDGRSAAGSPFDEVVAHGFAIRILTGAKLPKGVDTIVMQEDVLIENHQVHFQKGLKRGANCRAEGEDVMQGQVAAKKTTKLGAAQLALLSALNISEVTVYQKLRVGVLSTGDEIKPIGTQIAPHQVIDANRPMLLEIINKWGFKPVDLGHVPDDPKALEMALIDATKRCDVTLTSGGASAGDEDHLSAILAQNGNLDLWRIAIKPGRPLALGMWNGMPIFGLPGNPVAAFVTALIFARPTLYKMQGKGWTLPEPIMLPAGFVKSKKAGRREYLRARIGLDGKLEKFESEGSGRISGLAWANGLIELPDEAALFEKGDLMRYYPFEMFGI